MLVLVPLHPAKLLEIARYLTDGLLVGLFDAELLYQARVVCRNEENTMFVQKELDGQIPWADGMFTVALADADSRACQQIKRVLTRDGRLETRD